MTTEDSNDAGKIDVGQTVEDGLRIWRAREAIRQAEAKLVFQLASLTALEGRATSVTGWSVTGASVAVGAMVSSTLSPRGQYAALAALVPLVLAACLAVVVLLPRRWSGFTSGRALIESDYGTELEELEAMALGLADSAVANDTRLRSSGRCLASALSCCAFAPVGAALAWGVGR